MKALINKMNAIPGDSIGTVLSLHRTTEAAERADAALQRATRTGSGRDSYVPTIIVELTERVGRGAHVSQDQVAASEEGE
jgi:hypothetical protein